MRRNIREALRDRLLIPFQVKTEITDDPFSLSDRNSFVCFVCDLRSGEKKVVLVHALYYYCKLCLVHFHNSHQVFAALGARHDQTWIQSVTLCLLFLLVKLVHMCPLAHDSFVALSNRGFYDNRILLNRLGG